jgi:hypothetical protein
MRRLCARLQTLLSLAGLLAAAAGGYFYATSQRPVAVAGLPVPAAYVTLAAGLVMLVAGWLV